MPKSLRHVECAKAKDVATKVLQECQNGLVSRVNNRAAREGEDDSRYIFTSNVVVSAREESDFGELLDDKDWTELTIDANQRIWTDDYSNIVGAIWRNLRKAHFTSEE